MSIIETAYTKVIRDYGMDDDPQLFALHFYTRKMLRVMKYLYELLPENKNESEEDYAQIFATSFFSFMPPGTSCGDVLSQCISSPLTQDFLDSTHHKASASDIDDGGGTYTSSPSSSDNCCGSDSKSLVTALFNGKKIDIKDIVRWQCVYSQPRSEFVKQTADGFYESPTTLFTNNIDPKFTDWYVTNEHYVNPDLNHLNSILVLSKNNVNLYNYLYGHIKRLLITSDVNLAYLSLFINLLTVKPNSITPINRAFIGHKRDRLSAACFENPRKVLIDGAVRGDKLKCWTPSSFAFGFLPTHVGIQQNTYSVNLICRLNATT